MLSSPSHPGSSYSEAPPPHSVVDPPSSQGPPLHSPTYRGKAQVKLAVGGPQLQPQPSAAPAGTDGECKHVSRNLPKVH